MEKGTRDTGVPKKGRAKKPRKRKVFIAKHRVVKELDREHKNSRNKTGEKSPQED